MTSSKPCPTTADGVPIQLGDVIYYMTSSGVQSRKVTHVGSDHIQTFPFDIHFALVDGSLRWTYSAPEACEAAWIDATGK